MHGSGNESMSSSQKIKQFQGEINDIYMKADRCDNICRQVESTVQDLRERVFQKAESNDVHSLEERVTE